MTCARAVLCLIKDTGRCGTSVCKELHSQSTRPKESRTEPTVVIRRNERYRQHRLDVTQKSKGVFVASLQEGNGEVKQAQRQKAHVLLGFPLAMIIWTIFFDNRTPPYVVASPPSSIQISHR